MFRILTEKEYRVSQWSGGNTTEITIFPEGSAYADREFLFRVSSATVDLPESDYTSLPAYDRLITPLNGEMHLSHDGEREEDVEPFEIHAFDGASETHCRGTCTDFNLMTRKGRCEGQMAVLEIDPEEAILLNPVTEKQTAVFYLVNGNVRFVAGEKEISLSPGDSLILRDEKEEYYLESDDNAVFAVAMAEVLSCDHSFL